MASRAKVREPELSGRERAEMRQNISTVIRCLKGQRAILTMGINCPGGDYWGALESLQAEAQEAFIANDDFIPGRRADGS